MKYFICFVLGTTFGFLINGLLFGSAEDNLLSTKVPATTSDKTTYNPDFTPVKSNSEVTKNTEIAATEENSNIDISLNQEHKQAEEIEYLQSQVQTLESELHKLLELKSNYSQDKLRLAELTRELENLDESEITDQQMMELVDDDFSTYRRSQRGKLRDDIYDFHHQEDDLGWGYDMEMKISDFIQMHSNADKVLLSGVSCKENICELLIKNKQENGWSSIQKQMTQQPWYKFGSSNSMSRSDKNHLVSFYIWLKYTNER